MAKLPQDNCQHVEGVIHANPDPQRNDGQGCHFHAHAERNHQCFGEDGGQRQWHDCTDYCSPGTEGNKAQQDYGAVYPEQHFMTGLLDHYVGRRFDAGVASR
ncbi:hypothetical protein D3C71_695150 [compost metagenome]